MKLKILALGLVTVLLGTGITSAVVLAQDGDEDSESQSVSDFSERVAEILGLDAQTVDDAITRARQELTQEEVDQKIDWMIENGWITEEKAEEMRAKLTEAKAWPGHGFPFSGGMWGKGRHRFFGGGHGHRHRGRMPNGESRWSHSKESKIPPGE